MLDAYVGRQPIYDRDLNVLGYELLYRHSYDADRAVFNDQNQAASQTILSTFIDIGLERLVGNRLAFINLTRSLILHEEHLQLPSHRVVLEVLEDVSIDDVLVQALIDLSGRGYKIALDDVSNLDQLGPLLEIAHIVKVDLLQTDVSRLREQVETLRNYDGKLLAEKVETPDAFDLCKELGFDYFQGFFLCKPNVVRGRRMPATRMSILRLLAKLHSPDIEFAQLEDVIKQDVSLSYKLLRLINSAFYSLPRKVESIRHALTLLGLKQVQAWVTLLLLSRIDDKPHELMTTAMIRAKMCELMAISLDERARETFFTVGLFSVLDALLDLPLDDALDSLPLSDEIIAALLNHQGHMGAVLNCVLAYERGDWAAVSYPGLEPVVIRDTFLDSLDWAARVSRLLGGKGVGEHKLLLGPAT